MPRLRKSRHAPPRASPSVGTPQSPNFSSIWASTCLRIVVEINLLCNLGFTLEFSPRGFYIYKIYIALALLRGMSAPPPCPICHFRESSLFMGWIFRNHSRIVLPPRRGRKQRDVTRRRDLDRLLPLPPSRIRFRHNHQIPLQLY